MIDRQVRRWIDPWLDRLAEGCERMGLRANTLTWIGFAAGLGAALAVAMGAFTTAFGLIAANRVLDGLDGSLARRRGPTDLGGYLDIVLDTIFYSSVPFAFAVWSEANGLAAAFLIYSFVGTGGSFLTFAIIAAKRGLSADLAGKKSFFYSAGLIEGTETAVFLLLLCGLPDAFIPLAWTFGGLCWLTTILRIATAMAVFRNE